ncbi:MAG TPA: sigma-70 family RNA polymerase sigma factor [Planctomycetota bacterium]|nr:sigma-70 family RNA polymerase sigma factor [Planctomycetota bacterium]
MPRDSSLPSNAFNTTRWSIVLAARHDDARGRKALETLCGHYWYPLYAYVRRQNVGADEAAELTQAFFARFLEKNYLRDVRRERGRFRAFLLSSLKHFMANERDYCNALKRGGGRAIVSIDACDAEGRYRLEPSEGVTPERLFERRWALLLLERVLARLRAEFDEAGKGVLFETLKERLSGKGELYKEAAEKLGLSEAGVKTAVHRLRKRYREILREEIAQTVATAEDVEDEIGYLFEVLRA